MPYIPLEDRNYLHLLLTSDTEDFSELGERCRTSGELNYTITKIIHGYFKANGGRYQQINDIIGALEGAKLEFYRKVVAPYEQLKEAENGPV